MKKAVQRGRGFTLVEILLTTAITAVIGSAIYLILNTGMVLFAKNTAVNAAHQQARVAVIQMENDLHAAVSLPQMVDANRAVVGGVGPAAGISFQLFAAGPFKVTAKANAGQKVVQLDFGTYTPTAGQRLIIASHEIEFDIVSVAPGTGIRNVTLSENISDPILIEFEDPNTNNGVPKPVDVTGFVTDRVSYVVQNGELRYFGRTSSTSYTVMANDVTSTTPFSTPVSPTGTPYSRVVAAINLSTADQTAKARGFKSANMFLNAQVPCRAQLCKRQ